MIYEKFNGNSVSVCIENIDKKDPYTKIGAKAFLSCKDVYEIKLPDTICEVGDWAFAHMKELKRIVVPSNKISIGKDVFLDCDSLKEIMVYPDNTGNQGLPYLLASCITILKSYELLDFEMAAEQNETWCKLYDSKLIDYICQDDDRNFQPVIVGWFNDEGEEEQLERYIKKVKADKINLCFLRLKHDAHIEDSTKDILLLFLRKQIDNPDDDNFSWNTIREVVSCDIQYARLAAGNNLFNEELILDLIKYVNNNNTNTEIAAYLVSELNGKHESIDQEFDL